MPSNTIVLDVCGRKFRTTKSTLQTSDYFNNLFTRWEDCADRQEDGSFFVDADPDTFEHLLNFMRRPSRFPLYWTKEKGFDYVLYSKLAVEADFFLLHDLRDWIRKGRYLGAIRTDLRITKEPLLYFSGTCNTLQGHPVIENFYGDTGGSGPYRCPLGRHDGYPSSCHSNCHKERGTSGAQFDAPQKHIISIITTIRFVDEVCDNSPENK
jgi:hypothetical protein